MKIVTRRKQKQIDAEMISKIKFALRVGHNAALNGGDFMDEKKWDKTAEQIFFADQIIIFDER